MAWETTNQAAVHLWYEEAFGFSVPALHSSEEAVGTWPETATSVAVRLLSTDQIHIVAPCDLSDLFNMVLRRNPCRVTQEQFVQRMYSKHILRQWPRVQVIYDECEYCSHYTLHVAANILMLYDYKGQARECGCKCLCFLTF